MVVFAVITVLGIQMLGRSDLDRHTSTFVVAVALAARAAAHPGARRLRRFPPNVRILLESGVAVGCRVAAVLNVLFPPRQAGHRRAADLHSYRKRPMNQNRPRRTRRPGAALLAPDTVLLPEGPVGGVGRTGGRRTLRGPRTVDELEARYPESRTVGLPGHVLMRDLSMPTTTSPRASAPPLAFGEPSEIFRRVWVPLEGALDEESAYTAANWRRSKPCAEGSPPSPTPERAPTSTWTWSRRPRGTRGIRCVLGLVCNDADGETKQITGPYSRTPRNTSPATTAYPLVHPSSPSPSRGGPPSEPCTTPPAWPPRPGAVVQIHVNEHLAGVERSLVRHGLRPLEHLHRVGALGPQLLAAHATPSPRASCPSSPTPGPPSVTTRSPARGRQRSRRRPT